MRLLRSLKKLPRNDTERVGSRPAFGGTENTTIMHRHCEPPFAAKQSREVLSGLFLKSNWYKITFVLIDI
jgi:hypothetical protein